MVAKASAADILWPERVALSLLGVPEKMLAGSY